MKRTVLPAWELYSYGGCLLIGIIYSAHRVYDAGNEISQVFEGQLTGGWSFLGRRKDNADNEWRLWMNFIPSTLSAWILFHYIGARIVTTFYIPGISIWYAVVTALCVIQNFGWFIFVLFLLQPAIFCLLLLEIRSRLLIWSLSFGCCYFLINYSDVWSSIETYDQLGLVAATIMWIYLRCISFSMYIIENNNFTLSTTIAFFGYVFYLPCFFLGPILLFDNFFETMFRKTRKPTISITAELYLIVQNGRYFFWMLLVEFMLHYLYVNSLTQIVMIFHQIDYEHIWLLFGIGFHVGLFFSMKYTIVYGLTLTWTRAEGYETPNTPKCLAGMFLYSDVWRFFDHGLYLFIRKYIYLPCSKFTPSKTLWTEMGVQFICFTFVYVWHGLQTTILIWSLLNYCGIMLEIICRRISKTENYRRFQKMIGPRNERRLVGLVWAPFFVLSTVSNFYFLAGASVSETLFGYFFFRIATWDLTCFWLFMYAYGQVLMEIKSTRKTKSA